MKNVPRIFINQQLQVGKEYQLTQEQSHYLNKVMRADKCLVFNNGYEFLAELRKVQDKKTINYSLFIINSTEHTDPSDDIIFCFAPIKKTDEMLNMVTQMGVAKLQPVITERTVANHINWERMKKIIIEASEQSNRNSIPELLPPIKFADFIKMCKVQSSKFKLLFADERFAHNKENSNNCTLLFANCSLFIGPEGGFSDAEFAALDASGAIGISLGKTILRAETAAVAALAKIMNNK
jgi:16S rRNA (uracil1498-N3)-methyltransferase